ANARRLTGGRRRAPHRTRSAPRALGPPRAGPRARPAIPRERSSAASKPSARVKSDGATMRAIVFHEHGGPEVLRLEERWPRPEPRDGEALVEVKAVALNHLDIFVRRGMPGVRLELPHISGGDTAGVVAGTHERVLV